MTKKNLNFECNTTEPQNHELCFAKKGKVCNATTYAECPINCSFFKTKAQAAEDREKANKRIFSLPDKSRSFILNTYYIQYQEAEILKQKRELRKREKNDTNRK